MKIESIEIHNFKSLQNVSLTEIPGLAVFRGPIGGGKNTFFEVFAFLQDALATDVITALQLRGGFNEVVSRDQKEDISFLIRYRPFTCDGILTYELSIGLDGQKIPVVNTESLFWKGEKLKEAWKIMEFHRGKGMATCCDPPPFQEPLLETLYETKLISPHVLALNAIGNLADHIVVARFRYLIENCLICDFQIDDARKIQKLALPNQLTKTGNNLATVAHYMLTKHPHNFRKVLDKMKKFIPRISGIYTKTTEDKVVSLRFVEEGFEKAFLSTQVSSETIKIFMYLLLLNSPEPRPLLLIKDPTYQLEPTIISSLLKLFRNYTVEGYYNNPGQVFISFNATLLHLELYSNELYVLSKDKNRYTEVLHGSTSLNSYSLPAKDQAPGALSKLTLVTDDS